MSRDLMQEALRAGVLGGGASFEDALVTAFLKSGKEYVRQQALICGPVARAHAANVLGRTDHLAAFEFQRRGHAWTNMGVAEGRLRHLGHAVAARRHGWIAWRHGPRLRRGFARGPRFFRPKLSTLPGVARPLALAEEQIDRCIAFKTAKGAEIATAFSAVK
jgi:hypothetical protein